MADFPITDYVTRDLAALRGQRKHTMRKQRLYHFDVNTPRFGSGGGLACSWRYTVATEEFNDCDPAPSRLVKIGSAYGAPGGTTLGAIQVAVEHAPLNQTVFEFEGGHLTVIDLGNEPCTRLNGARISKCRVDEGDVIQLGADLARSHTSIRYIGCEDITLNFGSNPHPFVERSPITTAKIAPPTLAEKIESVIASNPQNYHPIVIEKPTMNKPGRSHDRKPLQFANPPSRERAPVSITQHQLYHAIRLAAQVGEATAQTRKPAMDALSSFLIGLNMQPADFLPKESAS